MALTPKLVLSGAIGLSLGLGLVWLTIKPPPPGMTEALPDSGDEDRAQGRDRAEDREDRRAEPEDRGEDPQAEDPAEPEARRAASEPTLELERGRVAYIRCGARERCPRDRDLEDAVWRLLEAVPTCPDGPGSAGSGDVRVHFEDGTVEVRFRDWGENPLALGPLRACLEPVVGDLSTRLGVRPLTVSFRFELRPLG